MDPSSQTAFFPKSFWELLASNQLQHHNVSTDGLYIEMHSPSTITSSSSLSNNSTDLPTHLVSSYAPKPTTQQSCTLVRMSEPPGKTNYRRRSWLEPLSPVEAPNHFITGPDSSKHMVCSPHVKSVSRPSSNSGASMQFNSPKPETFQTETQLLQPDNGSGFECWPASDHDFRMVEANFSFRPESFRELLCETKPRLDSQAFALTVSELSFMRGAAPFAAGFSRNGMLSGMTLREPLNASIPWKEFNYGNGQEGSSIAYVSARSPEQLSSVNMCSSDMTDARKHLQQERNCRTESPNAPARSWIEYALDRSHLDMSSTSQNKNHLIAFPRTAITSDTKVEQPQSTVTKRSVARTLQSAAPEALKCSFLETTNRSASRSKQSASIASLNDTNQSKKMKISNKPSSRHPLGPALNTNYKPRARQGSANDPQSIAARHRRERINTRLKALQELVPNGSKVDLVTMLEKAINYVKFLQLQLKVLTDDEYWKSPPQSAEPNTDEMVENDGKHVSGVISSCS